MKGNYYWSVLVVFTVICTSCGIDSNDLTPEERHTVDTLYSNQINQWRSKVDSLCIRQKDSLYLLTIDSLKKEGLKEIEMLLTKNHVIE